MFSSTASIRSRGAPGGCSRLGSRLRHHLRSRSVLSANSYRILTPRDWTPRADAKEIREGLAVSCRKADRPGLWKVFHQDEYFAAPDEAEVLARNCFNRGRIALQAPDLSAHDGILVLQPVEVD